MGGPTSFVSLIYVSLLVRGIGLGLRGISSRVLGVGDFVREVWHGGLALHPLDH